MLSDDDIRKDFEKQIMQWGWATNRNECGFYTFHKTNNAWFGWLAACQNFNIIKNED